MKLILVFVLLATAFNSGTAWRHFMRELDSPSRTSRSSKSSEELWFTQLLNHFNPADSRVWKQRYFINNAYYKSNGSMFLFVGAESPASSIWVRQGQMFEEAKRFGAKMFVLEHRFYGMSQPTSDLSVENLSYLNTQQAMLDLAYFIESMNEAHQLSKDTKWILFGCSYAGSLVAWMRAKYPHLVYAAVSCSGPLLAKVDFPEYMVVVEDSLKSHSQACVDALSSATKEVDSMLQNSVGQRKLEKLFKLCDPIDSSKTTNKDIANLYSAISNLVAFVVQYNKNNRNGNKITIGTLCDVLAEEKKGVAIDRLAEVINLMLKHNGEKCLDYRYAKEIKELNNITLTEETRRGGRQWIYQTCTEFGFYVTSTTGPKLFGDHLPLDFFLQMCADIFGPAFSRALIYSGVERTNIIFGALDLENTVSNVVFVHGSIDPWYPLGITKSNNPNAPAIFIDGTAHCATVYPTSKNDSPQLTEARKQMTRLIGQWLED